MTSKHLVALSLFCPLVACSSQDGSTEDVAESLSAAAQPFAITSPAFSDGDPIPDAHTCNGKPFGSGYSPELDWAKGQKPHGVRSYAVVFKDISLTQKSPPDNRGWHNAIWDIRTHGLREAMGGEEFVDNPPHARQWSRYNPYGYLGPCPNWDPTIPDRTDTYSFTLYAFDQEILDPLPPVHPVIANYTRFLDEYFQTIAIAQTELTGTSDAKPTTGPGVPPPAPPPAPRP
jgi:phosphatidylethanolamine-binding protein (PEBP) family uncharacterized protein